MNLIKSLKISWLSPEKIKKISFAKDNFMINSSKVMNVRTFKPELGGLFDPRIFGPFLNYECYCGKYKGKENKGQKCERCEVLITEKNIQRWRMGHITLASPVTNIILFKNLATNLSKILEIPAKSLEDIIYFRVYIVIDNGLTNLLKKKEILEKKIDPNLIGSIFQEIIKDKKINENIINQAKELERGLIEKTDTETNNVFLEDYLDFLEKNWKVKIWTGTEAFRKLLHAVNVEEELKKIENISKKVSQKTNNEKTRFLRALQKTGTKLEWMIIDDLPVIPCGLRPVTKLKDEDTIATTQINNLYHKVTSINERLNYYLDLNKEMGVFFNEIIHNEKRRLQKAVDQLLYGSPRQQVEVKSLLQNLSGKEGILRRYSLGKRVNYSARSVIVPNPNLLLDQIGIPVKMALTLYKQFVIQKILKEKVAFTVKEAEQLLLNEAPIIFTLLDKVIQNHPVLVNRAPSLHRLSIQGFYPQLTLSNSIELHPLITTALNADFDGDQIAVHLPLSKKSCEEVKKHVLSPQHIIDPKNGHLIDVPNQDMILGIYYLTKEDKQKKYAYYDEMGSIWRSHNKNEISLHEPIIVPACLVARNFSNVKNQFIFTTLGKLIFNQILPPSFPSYLNNLEEYNKEGDQYKETGIEMEKIEEKRKNYLPLKGWKKKDIINFLNKLARTTSREEMVEFLDKLKKLGFDYVTYSGISISPFELGEIVFKEKKLKQSEEKIKQVDEHYSQGFYSREESKQKKINIWEQCKSDLQEQLISNLEKKNNTSFYHIWDSGARASSENLVQLFVMRGHATNYLGETIEAPITSSLWEGLSPFEFFTSVYGAVKGMIDISLKTAAAGDLTRRLVESSQNISIVSSDCQTTTGILLEENNALSLAERIYGRYLAHDIPNKKKEIILTRNTLLLEEEIKKIKENKISSVWVRSLLNCELVDGICQRCYGSDLSRPGEIISMGAAVGVIAAQSLGEPGTQLTMRTFHTGGITGDDEDITQGLPKVKQIFDDIKPKREEKATLAKTAGEIISIEETMIKQRSKEGGEIVYPKDKERATQINQGDRIEKGEKIITGKIDLEEYLEIMGPDICQNYIREEIRKVYGNQGIDINEKHIEIFARQMLSRVEVTDSGDGNYLSGDIEIYQQIQKVNQSLVANKKKPISFKRTISSLKDLASTPKSFLAGISFQNTLKSLINYSLYQPTDYLKGSKESLIAGQLVPVGTGFSEREKVLKEVTNKIE